MSWEGKSGGSVMLPQGEFNARSRLEEGQNCRGRGPEGGRWGEVGSGRRTRLVAGQKREG